MGQKEQLPTTCPLSPVPQRSPVSSRYTCCCSSALCLGITHTLPAWARSWASAFYCRRRAPSPKDRYPSLPTGRFGGRAAPEFRTGAPKFGTEAALLASKAVCSPILLCGPEQVTSPLLGLILPLCSIRKLNLPVSQGPSKSAVLWVSLV